MRLAALFALALAACQVQHRSGAFTCAGDQDCEDGRTCNDDGFCVVAGPEVDGAPADAAPDDAAVTSDASSCPEGCDLCEGGRCVIDCSAERACDGPVVCESEMPCEIRCTGARSCSGPITCSSPAGCLVTCGGNRSCPDSITCSGGACEVSCEGFASCGNGVSCSEACACDTSCTGVRSCGPTPECPEGCLDSDSGQCSSAADGCDSC